MKKEKLLHECVVNGQQEKHTRLLFNKYSEQQNR